MPGKLGKKSADVGKLKCKIENVVNSRPGSTQRKKVNIASCNIYKGRNLQICLLKILDFETVDA